MNTSADGGSPAYEPNPSPGITATSEPADQPAITSRPEATASSRPPRPLTRKQKAFVKELIDNPTISATEAAARTYNVANRETAQAVASENLSKPMIRLELEKYSGTAELVLVEVMDYSRELGRSGKGAGAQYAGVAVQAAKDILDRVHGKATQRTEHKSTSVTLNIDLTQTVTTEEQ